VTFVWEESDHRNPEASQTIRDLKKFVFWQKPKKMPNLQKSADSIKKLTLWESLKFRSLRFISETRPLTLMTTSPSLRRNRQPKAFVVSASILVLWLSGHFPRPESVKALVFEAGLELREIPAHFFGGFESLRSVCIPAYVEFIRTHAFVSEFWSWFRAFQTLTFEAGSKLQCIETLAFSGCFSLKSICLPASIKEIGGGAFSESGICEISIEAGNPHFVVSGHFLMDFEQTRVIQYFGCESGLTIPSEIEIFCTHSFSTLTSIATIKFCPGSKNRSIEAMAFGRCGSLRSLCIPASVECIGRECFTLCLSLSVVEFEPGSILREIEDRAFWHCNSLNSIAIPSSVQSLGLRCFMDCYTLQSVRFLPDSKLLRVGESAFALCRRLSSLSIPPLVEFIGKHCFAGCSSLSILPFEPPSRIRALLDLPPRWFGFHPIPDSVEQLAFQPACPAGEHYLLTFTYESNLVSLDPSEQRPLTLYRSFVHLSSRSLSAIRANLEFTDSRI
jgi:hypothetical protein